MKRFWNSCLSLIFPLLLSLLPVAGLYLEGQQRKGFELEQTKILWKQNALNLVEEVRAGCSLESQINQMAHKLRRHFSRITNSEETISPEKFIKIFREAFPQSHRPKGSSLYYFERKADGTLFCRSSPGLSTIGGKTLGNLFSRILEPGNISPAEARKLQERIRGIFGENLDYEILAVERRGRLTPVNFNRKESLIIWDGIYRGKQNLGTYLFHFPYSTFYSARPVSFALKGKTAKYKGMFTVLVPLPGEAKRFPPVFSRDQKLPPVVRKNLRSIIGDYLKNPLIPRGEICEPAKGIWVYRDILNPTNPYEIWITGEIPQPRMSRSEAWMKLFGVIFAVIWVIVLSQVVLQGEPPAISMKAWMMSFFIFLAIVSLSSMYFFASNFIETATIRKTQDEINNFRKKLEEVDLKVSDVLQNHTSAFRNLVFNPEWVGGILSSDAEKKFWTAEQTFKTAKSLEKPIVLENIILYYLFPKYRKINLAPVNSVFYSGQITMDFYEAFVLGTVDKIQSLTSPSGKKIIFSDQGTPFSKFLLSSLSPVAFRNFFVKRQQADLTDTGKERSIVFHDFIGSRDKIQCVVLFIANPGEAYRLHMSNETTRFNLESTNRAVFGKISNGGFDAPFPADSKFWNSRSGRWLKSIMDLAAISGTDKILQFPRQCYIGRPCKAAKGYILGGIVSLDEIISTSSNWRLILMLTVVFMLGLISLIGYFTANRLLLPLADVENGLRKVAEGDYSHRLKLIRNDELGDLSLAFDNMINGIQERKELGLFVSSHLNLALSSSESGKTLPASRKIGTVLVSDLRSFTTLSEKFSAREVVSMLNTHLQAMSEEILAHGGFVEQFIGDAIVGIFFEEDEGKSAEPAVNCAKAMMSRHLGIQKARLENKNFTYDIGVGLDHGMVLSGTMGTGGRREYVILGQPRTRAEHLEALSKKGKLSRIIVSKEVSAFCPSVRFESLGEEGVFEVDERIIPA